MHILIALLQIFKIACDEIGRAIKIGILIGLCFCVGAGLVAAGLVWVLHQIARTH